MANVQHERLLLEGIAIWNEWRIRNPASLPGLSRADFNRWDLSEANLSGTNLHRAKLSKANFWRANLSQAILS
jgi:uncharacterized protein YjbI with pentapeptide repeats